MKVKYEEDKKLNHHDVYIRFHPKNKETIYLLMKSLNDAIGEIEVFDDFNNHYTLTIMSIYYVEIIEHKIFIYTKDNVYRRNDTMKSLKERLKKYGFFQVNVRTLVNKNHVSCYRVEKECRRIIDLDNKESIIVNRNYKKEFKENIGDDMKR